MRRIGSGLRSVSLLPSLTLLALAACPGGARPPVLPLDPAPADAGIGEGAAAPMPPADYVAGRARVLAEADAVIALINAGDGDGLFARFSPEMAKAVPLPQVKLLAAAAQRDGGITGIAEARAVPMSPRVKTYVANVRVGESERALAMAFDEAWRIAGIQFSPLPEAPPPGPGAPVVLGFPAPGTWLVFWGGDDPRDNYHVIVPQQRHAYDLVMWKDGGTFTGDGLENEDYHCFGEPIESPVDARVTEVVSDLPDNVPGQTDPAHRAGNHVMLEVGPSRYLLLAHLQQDSIVLRLGDQVRRGAQIGRCGNSGNTSEPHLHLHIQDKPGVDDAGAVGLPLHFRDVLVDGTRLPVSAPVRGRFVQRAP